MSRFGRVETAALRSILGSYPWHATCLVVLPGCLYVAPVWREPVDLDPDILRPEFSPGEVLDLIFEATSERATVVAQDPEQKPLFFVWDVPHDVDFEEVELEQPGGITVSTVVIPNDPVLDDSEMTCSVFDPAGNSADVTWHLVVQ